MCGMGAHVMSVVWMCVSAAGKFQMKLIRSGHVIEVSGSVIKTSEVFTCW